MIINQPKIGLVLSGGGAKGAYQAGVVKYLAEINIQPQAISGASIGALNGAIVAGSATIQDAAIRLAQVWQKIADDSPLTLNKLNLSISLLRTVLSMYGGKSAFLLVNQLSSQFAHILPKPLQVLLADPALLDHQPVQNLLEEFANIDQLRQGLPLWLSVCPSDGATQDIIQLATALLGFSDTKQSHFLKVQNLNDTDIHKALLASAAIPLAYEAQTINETQYCDGGVGGWWTAQGNTPITPLIEHEQCTHIIVTHLEDGSLWDRRKFPQTTILEIRPRRITRKGLSDILAFEKDYILEWMEQGYIDAKASIEPVLGGLLTFKKSQESSLKTKKAVDDMNQKLQWLK